MQVWDILGSSLETKGTEKPDRQQFAQGWLSTASTWYHSSSPVKHRSVRLHNIYNTVAVVRTLS